MENFSFSTSRVLFEHPLTLAAQGELLFPFLMGAPIILSFYIQNPEMRKSLLREMQTQISQLLEVILTKLTICANVLKNFAEAQQGNNLQV